MLRLNLKITSLCLCLALASCQSVQVPKPETNKPLANKPIIKDEPKIDQGLKIINIAVKLIKDGDLETAKDILEKYLTNNTDIRATINLALIYMKTNQLAKAKELFTSIHNADKSDSIALEHLAIISRQNGEFKKAKNYYQQALETSDRPSIHLNYAILLDLYLNELNTALTHY